MPLPGRAHWLAYLRFLSLFLAIFLPVYAGSGHLLAQLPDRSIPLHFAWEKDIPLVPWMIWPYLSLFSLYLLPLLHLSPQEMNRLARQSVLAVVVAGVFFLAVPARMGFSPTAVTGLHEPLFRLIALVDTPCNLMPSLHVTGAALIVLGCCTARLSRRATWMYRLWLATLAVSTVLVHQHHLIDVIAGFALALAARRLIPLSGPSAGA